MDSSSETTLGALRLFGGEAPDPLPPGFWDAVLVAAKRHRIAPLLDRLLESPPAGLPEAPPHVRERVRQERFLTLAANLRFQRGLAQVLGELRRAGVPAVLLKGAHLAYFVYPDPGLRPMGDFDVLVPLAGLAEADAAMRRAGYAPNRGYRLEAELGYWAHLPCFMKEGARPVEVHWRLLRPEEPYPVDVEGLIARARPVSSEGLEAFVPDPADALIHLCLHAAAADRFLCGALPLFDIRELVRTTPPHWPDAWERASRCGAARCVWLTLALCESLLPGSVPREAGLDARVPEGAAGMRDVARSFALGVPDRDSAVSPNLARALHGTPASALALVARRLFPSRAEMDAIYSPGGHLLQRIVRYPRRWAALASQFSPAALRALGRRSGDATVAGRFAASDSLAGWLSGPRAK